MVAAIKVKDVREREAFLAVQPRVERNSPCPCGSGAKWKHCCANEGGRWLDARRAREKISAAWR